MPYAKTSLRSEMGALRERMRGMGCGYREIAAEFARVYRLRPRAAWRNAYGWSLREAADRINSYRGVVGLDSNGLAGMTAPHLCEYENWPGWGANPTGRKPGPYLLAVLAGIYRCDVTDLVDAADRERLPKADLLIIDTYARPEPSNPGTQESLAGNAQREANQALRRVREEERHETRREFAEAMARVAFELGEDVCPDEKYVERLESGAISWPHPPYRKVLSTLCGHPIGELGFTAPVLSRPEPGVRADAGNGASVRMNVPLRNAIMESGMEVSELARKVGVDPKTVQRWITLGRIPHPRHRWKASQILGCDEFGLWPHAIASREPDVGWTGSPQEDDEDMERRRLLQDLAALGIAISPVAHAVESIRFSFGSAFGHNDRDHLDDWEDTVREYGYSYLATSPMKLIPDLAADLIAIRSIAARLSGHDPQYRGWCRIGATLSGLMAKSLSNLGNAREARQWWNMAQHVSDTSGDLELGLWVRGQRIIHGLYENRPVQVLCDQARDAIGFAHGHICAGLADVHTGLAQVSVLAGDYVSAVEELRKAQHVLSLLPLSVTRDTGSAMGWGETKLRYTETWVYAHMGDERKTDEAVQRALRLFPRTDARGPAQVKLMQAFARVRSGDISEGIRHAYAVYLPLASGQRTTMVDMLAQRVLVSVPAEMLDQPDVDAYRELVAPRDQRAIEA
jgi:transcriptional regulator with XRE-family HTH domain